MRVSCRNAASTNRSGSPLISPWENGHSSAGGSVVIWPHTWWSSGRNAAAPPPSPAAGAPLRQGGAFGAEGGVLAVAGVERGLVGEAVEQLRRDVVDERCE